MILSGLAQWERDLLIERTREGVAHARSQGRVDGPKSKLTLEQVKSVHAAVNGGQTIAKVARAFNISRPMIYKALERRGYVQQQGIFKYRRN